MKLSYLVRNLFFDWISDISFFEIYEACEVEVEMFELLDLSEKLFSSTKERKRIEF